MTITFFIITKEFIICILNFRGKIMFSSLLYSLFTYKRSRVNLLDCWQGRIGISGWDSTIFMLKVKIPMYVVDYFLDLE